MALFPFTMNNPAPAKSNYIIWSWRVEYVFPYLMKDPVPGEIRLHHNRQNALETHPTRNTCLCQLTSSAGNFLPRYLKLEALLAHHSSQSSIFPF